MLVAFYFSSLILYPSSPPEDIVAIRHVDTSFDQPIQIEFLSPDNKRFDAWYFERSAQAQCVIIFTHGWNSSRIRTEKFMRAMSDTQCNYVSYDLRGHGTHEAQLSTGGVIEKQELIQISRYLVDTFGFSESDIGWFGLSLGGSISLQAAPLDFKPAFIIADSPFQDWHTAIFERGVEMYGEWVLLFRPAIAFFIRMRAGVDYTNASPVKAAESITRPVLLVHSLSDTDTAPEQSSAIYQRLDPIRTQLVLTEWGAAHGKDIDMNPEAYQKLLNDFIKQFSPAFFVVQSK